jgi:diguanylate cyclase (GGDEF)-like protein/PAS domain S-box-containing protein
MSGRKGLADLIHPSHYAGSVFCLRLLLLSLLITVLTLVFHLPTNDLLFQYLPLHTTLESMAIVVSISVFAIGWNTRRYHQHNHLLWISILFLGVGVFDFSHTISFEGMPDFISTNTPNKTIHFWLAARTLAVIGLLGAALIPSTTRIRYKTLLLVVVITLILVHYLVLYRLETMPVAFAPGQGLTTYKLMFEYGLIAAYSGTALLFFRHMTKPCNFSSCSLMASALLMAQSEYFFTLYSTASDSYNLIGHLYKIAAYAILYKALFIENITEPYEQLKRSQQRLTATIEAVPDWLFELDESGNVLEVYARPENDSFSSAELKGQNLANLIPAEAVTIFFDAMADARAHGPARNRQVVITQEDSERCFTFSVSWHKSGNHHQDRYLVLSRDETDAIHQQKALANEALLNANLLTLARLAQSQNEADFLGSALQRLQHLTRSEHSCFYLINSLSTEPEPLYSSADGHHLLPLSTLQYLASQPDKLLLNHPHELQIPGVAHINKQLQRLASIMVTDADQPCLLAVCTNKTSVYNAQDLEDMQILAESIWQLVRRRRMEQAIETLSLTVSQSPHSIVITAVNGKIEYVNDTFIAHSGYQRDEVIGKTPQILKSEKTPGTVTREIWAQLNQGKIWKGELVNRRKNGSEYIQRLSIYPVRDNRGTIVKYISHGEDITANKEADALIQQLSHYDQLTALPNRLMLEERFEQALDSARRYEEHVALICLDLDNFRDINDTLGHSVGDFMLQQTSLRIRNLLPTRDTVSRLSGDNFLIVLPGTDIHQAALCASEILTAIEQPIIHNEQELSITASIGIALYPLDGVTIESLLMGAEAAMFQVKHNGRNGYRFFAPGMQEHSSRSLALGNALKHALFNHELRLAYQPQYSLKKHQLVGAEVLLRWQHPLWGSISPAEFIPMAETGGLIIPITEWIARSAARQLLQWQQQGLQHLVLAINLSATHFARPGLCQSLTTILAEEGISPDCIELELTEAVALKNPEAVIQTMQELKDAGFHLAIDDFGTGYSSMSYLKRFSVDKLKIDQSFVRDLNNSRDDQAIVMAICQITDSLGMLSIAEGVETQEQLQQLQDAGCDEIQGYLYSRPLTAEAFAEFALNPDFSEQILMPQPVTSE